MPPSVTFATVSAFLISSGFFEDWVQRARSMATEPWSTMAMASTMLEQRFDRGQVEGFADGGGGIVRFGIGPLEGGDRPETFCCRSL